MQTSAVMKHSRYVQALTICSPKLAISVGIGHTQGLDVCNKGTSAHDRAVSGLTMPRSMPYLNMLVEDRCGDTGVVDGSGRHLTLFHGFQHLLLLGTRLPQSLDI
jgi:hypothetical protein